MVISWLRPSCNRKESGDRPTPFFRQFSNPPVFLWHTFLRRISNPNRNQPSHFCHLSSFCNLVCANNPTSVFLSMELPLFDLLLITWRPKACANSVKISLSKFPDPRKKKGKKKRRCKCFINKGINLLGHFGFSEHVQILTTEALAKQLRSKISNNNFEIMTFRLLGHFQILKKLHS